MATRAEQFKSASERKGLRKPAAVKKAKKPAGTKASAHAGRKAAYALETSESGKPSRKSSRGGSKQHIKPDAALHNRATMRAVSPTAQAARGTAKKR